MRVAVISDIHGNAVALRRVLADIRQRNSDQIVCLGDVATLGPQPRQVIAELRRLSCAVVMGNHDAWLLGAAPATQSSTVSRVSEMVGWARGQLSQAEIAFVRTFQLVVDIPLGDGVNLLCFHGSPRSYDDVVLTSTSDNDLDSMFDRCNATILAGGHTHMQMVRRHRECILINPGSVGVPFRYIESAKLPPAGKPSYGPWAEYAIVTYASERLSIELYRVPVDVGKIKRLITASRMPHAAWLLGMWE